MTKNGMSGQQLQEILLRDYALQMEMASGNYVVAMTSFMDTEEGFRRLSHALHAMDARMEDTGKAAFFAEGHLPAARETDGTVSGRRSSTWKRQTGRSGWKGFRRLYLSVSAGNSDDRAG